MNECLLAFDPFCDVPVLVTVQLLTAADIEQVLSDVTLLTVRVLPDKLHPVPDTVAPLSLYPLLADIVNVPDPPYSMLLDDGLDEQCEQLTDTVYVFLVSDTAHVLALVTLDAVTILVSPEPVTEHPSVLVVAVDIEYPVEAVIVNEAFEPWSTIVLAGFDVQPEHDTPTLYCFSGIFT